jgi:hypothetical protein
VWTRVLAGGYGCYDLLTTGHEDADVISVSSVRSQITSTEADTSAETSSPSEDLAEDIVLFAIAGDTKLCSHPLQVQVLGECGCPRINMCSPAHPQAI